MLQLLQLFLVLFDTATTWRWRLARCLTIGWKDDLLTKLVTKGRAEIRWNTYAEEPKWAASVPVRPAATRGRYCQKEKRNVESMQLASMDVTRTDGLLMICAPFTRWLSWSACLSINSIYCPWRYDVKMRHTVGTSHRYVAPSKQPKSSDSEDRRKGIPRGCCYFGGLGLA